MPLKTNPFDAAGRLFPWAGSGQTTSLDRTGDLHMHIEPLEKRASEKELVARLSSNEDDSLTNQELAELLRSRIEELDRRLAILNSEREKSSDFWKSRSTGFVAWTTPKLWQRLPR